MTKMEIIEDIGPTFRSIGDIHIRHGLRKSGSPATLTPGIDYRRKTNNVITKVYSIIIDKTSIFEC